MLTRYLSFSFFFLLKSLFFLPLCFSGEPLEEVEVQGDQGGQKEQEDQEENPSKRARIKHLLEGHLLLRDDLNQISFAFISEDVFTTQLLPFLAYKDLARISSVSKKISLCLFRYQKSIRSLKVIPESLSPLGLDPLLKWVSRNLQAVTHIVIVHQTLSEMSFLYLSRLPTLQSIAIESCEFKEEWLRHLRPENFRLRSDPSRPKSKEIRLVNCKTW